MVISVSKENRDHIPCGMDPGRVDEFWLLFIFLKLLSLEFACISHRRMRGWIHCNASTSAEASLKKRRQRAGIKGGSSLQDAARSPARCWPPRATWTPWRNFWGTPASTAPSATWTYAEPRSRPCLQMPSDTWLAMWQAPPYTATHGSKSQIYP